MLVNWSLAGILVVIIILVEHHVQLGGGVSVEEELSLTFDEKKALDEFKTRMTPLLPHAYMKQDLYLIRWLRAKDLNLDAATEMLRQNLQWRQENRMDSIRDEDWSDMKEEYDYTLDTVDKQGRPIGTLSIGSWNHRKAVLTGKGPRLLRYLDKLLEEANQRVIELQARGRRVTQWKVLLNLEGFNIPENACAGCLGLHVNLVNSIEQHYPGHVDQIILINTPPAFQVVLQVVRPLFSTSTVNALRVFGHDKNVWGKYLDKEISREERRYEFGGTRKD